MDDQATTQDPQSGATASDDNGAFIALQSELEASKARLSELTQISQQALADLQNFKKRTEDEKIKFVAYANAALMTDMLPVLDNINRAVTHIPEDPAAKEWATGILAVMKQLEETLKSRGLETIENTTGETFNPTLHEAVMTEAGPHDQIIKEVEKGYKIADRILRRAKVSVGNTGDASAPTAEDTVINETTTENSAAQPEASSEEYV